MRDQLLLLVLCAVCQSSAFAQSLARVDLRLPEIAEGLPGPGKRVAITSPEYEGTSVHHMLYLPEDWTSDWQTHAESWPVVVEYTGNYFPTAGSTGRVENAGLGFGLSRGQAIWLTLPFVDSNQKGNAVTWWGDVAATVEYAKAIVPRVLEKYGGNKNAVILCGFSRGAIAVNFIGLYDDKIAGLWSGLMTHDHYDGVRQWRGTDWGSPLKDYRVAARKRLRRIGNRPVLICQNGTEKTTQDYLREQSLVAKELELDSFQFLDLSTRQILGDFPNDVAVHPHTDRWLLAPSEERKKVWDWFDKASGR